MNKQIIIWMSLSAAGNLHVFVVSQRSTSQLGGDTYQRLVSTSDGSDAYYWQAPDWTLTSPYLDGVSQVYGLDIRSLRSASGNLTVANISIGRDAAKGISRFSGDIVEVLVYTNALSDAGSDSVQSYLDEK